MPKISLDEYGDPPEPPGVEEIIDDIKRATLDDIVFKSSNAVEKIYNTNRNNDSNLLQDDGMLLLKISLNFICFIVVCQTVNNLS